MRLIMTLTTFVTGLIFRFTITILSIYGLIAIIISALFLEFALRTEAHNAGSDTPRTAVVFTGDFDRIHKGLDLLSSGRAARLFITGVNGDAGLNTDRFAEQFDLTAEQASWISSEKIVLAADAHTTLENAWETACWLDSQPEIQAITLITSRQHMARASVALNHAISPIEVVRVISNPSDEYNKFQIDLIEFGKFIATWGITIFPPMLWPANEPTICMKV